MKVLDRPTFFGVVNEKVRVPLIGSDEADLMRRDPATGRPSYRVPETGPWPALIRRLQDGVFYEGGVAYCDALDADLHKGILWWTKGTDGVCGKGGWEKEFPFTSIKAFYEARGETFPTVAALFADLPDDEPELEVQDPAMDLMNTSRVAAFLGYSTTKVLKLAKSGALGYERTTSGYYVFRFENVVEFMRNHGKARWGGRIDG